MYTYRIIHNGVFDWEKCAKWPQNDLDRLKVKKYPCDYCINPQGSNFHPLCSTMSHFWVTKKILLVHQMTPKWPWHQYAKIKSICMLHTESTPFSLQSKCLFLLVSLYDETFSSCIPFFRKKCTEWPQNDFGMSKVINTNMHAICTPEAQMSCFTVAPLFSEKCTEWPQMTLTCSRSKIPICMLH